MPLDLDSVHVWRNSDGVHHVAWETTQAATQVVVEPLSVGAKLEYPQAGRTSVKVTGLAAGSRHQFRLDDQQGNQIVVGERRLGFRGAPNFRDFGGYPTREGGRVKWGYLFRAGQLSALTDTDITLLAALKLDLVCDFRREDEQLNDPNRLPAYNTPSTISLPIVPGSNARFFEEAEQGWSGSEPMFNFMVHINQDFAESQSDTYARMFRAILDCEQARFLVHCAAGKDRTGFAAAIMLLALGVPRDLVMRDYMLTRQFFLPSNELPRIRGKYDMQDLPEEAILPMLEVHEVYLDKALDTIDSQYGSIERYLDEAMGLTVGDREELRSRYVEAGSSA